MGISIRDSEVAKLAKELAELRGTNMTEAIGWALRDSLARARGKSSLAARLEKLGQETVAMAGPNRREVTKDEIDDLWGQ